MTTTYTPAPQVATVAQRAIAKWHPHLADVRIEYVFRDPAAKTKGKVVLGKARKLSGLNSALVTLLNPDWGGEEPEDFFVMEIARPAWDAMDTDQRLALVDHELCHFTVEVDDEGQAVLKILGHDLEAFNAEVERHGLWKRDIEDFLKAAANAGRLAVEDEDEEGGAS